MIPLVAASERGRAQTHIVLNPAGVAVWGLRELLYSSRQAVGGVTNLGCSRILLERRAAEGESPVGETFKAP